MKEQKKHLYYLDELSDYKVDSHYADVRGWPVKDHDNRVIGKVDNLLVNKNLLRVVYLDVEVDKTIIDANYDPYSNSHNSDVREFVNKEGENHVIVPIGMININEEQKYVNTESIDHQTFAETKRFKTGDNVDRDYEVAVMDSYNRDRDRHDNEQISEDSRAQKESPYNADRDADHIQRDLNTDAEWSEERQKLELERHKLKEERLKLEEERKKLEEERKRRDLNKESDSTNDADREKRDSSNKHDPNDDDFYDRGEFDGANYRNS
ncbi:hypothetical protein [Gillisia hiemivivida]|uniref:hypothetical protein n=1 Tax=Gillisia hiemivivida TaxID=291190 RepID=UPI001B882962|nr:hypothetical protein [Gillisia hiemivivida]